MCSRIPPPTARIRRGASTACRCSSRTWDRASPGGVRSRVARSELDAEITAWSRELDKHEAMRILCEAGVAASAVNDTMDVFTDPHLNARGFIQRVPHPDHGEVTLMGSPIRMSDSSVELRAGPLLGQHTDDVLAEELAIGAETLGALREAGAIGAPADAATAATAE